MESVRPTRTLGVTGGIGSGKSAVTRILSTLGARVFAADPAAKEIMLHNEAVRKELIDAFGTQSYLEDGTLNRAYLAGLIFGDDEKVALMNSIVHPRVFQAFQAKKQDAIRDNIPVLIHEAALVYESGGYKHLDAVLVVHAPLEVRIKRVMARDNTTREHILNRMKHQLPPEELLQRADYVIYNDGTLEHLQEQSELFYSRFINEG